MTIIKPQITFTKEDVECIKKLGELCRFFDFGPWEVIDAVEDGCGLNIVDFIYENE